MNSASLIRDSAKAIIVRNGCVLLVGINDEDGEWYVLPGGVIPYCLKEDLGGHNLRI
jgi:hypothetical protein